MLSDGTTGRSAGHVYIELIGSQLTEERAAKTSLDQRGAQVVTWAGGLVAASVALLEVVPDDTPVATVAVVIGAILLVIAAFLATRVIQPADYQEADLNRLRAIISEPAYMEADEKIGLRRMGEQALDVLDEARKVNKRKAERLRDALTALAAGAAALAVAVGAIAYEMLRGTNPGGG
jgi:hypothetical protein